MDKKHIVALCLFCLAIGFFAGRQTFTVKTETKYVKGDSISGTASDIVLVSETIPVEPELIYRTDTIYRDNMVFIETKVDSTAIFNEYIARREFATVLFDTPTLGKLSLFETIQYNRPAEIRYDFVPIYKETTKYKIPVWNGFAGTSVNTFGQASGFAGVFHKNFGAGASYIRDFERERNGYGIMVVIKF